MIVFVIWNVLLGVVRSNTHYPTSHFSIKIYGNRKAAR
jgi:hypothetical protein